MVLYPFANIHWWKSFIQHPCAVNIDEFLYSKNQSYNKYCIISANGALNLSIPIEKGRNQRTPFSDIRISYHENWQKIHWRSLTAAYNNSAFFEYYSDRLEQLFTHQFDYLHEFNSHTFRLVCDILRLQSENINNISIKELFKDEKLSFLYNNKKIPFSHPEYYQVFADRSGFKENASVLDLIFNMGTESALYLKKI